MSFRLIRLELCRMARDRSAWVLLVVFAASLAYGLWNGARVARPQREAAIALTKSSEEFLAQVRQALGQQAIDPKAVAGRGTMAVLPSAALPLLAIGQSDLSPGHESVVLWRLTGPGEARAELANPSHLLAGRFDLAFVLVWLYPLCLLALVYDLLAGDREAGTLRLALAHGISPARWLTHRALARASPVLVLAVLATLAAGGLAGSSGILARLILAVAVVLVYGLFWTVLAGAVNVLARTAAGAATTLGAAWALLVLVTPTLLNVAVESLYPTPSRPELIAAARQASRAAEARGGELLNSFYRDHPELAPAGQQADFAAQHLTVQTEVGRAIEPVREKFDLQLQLQQAAVGRWRFISPAVATYEALTDLAGTGYWRNRAFRRQVHEFKQTVAEFYTPKIHRREALTSMDFDRLPRSVFREEPAGHWVRRTIAGLGGMSVFIGGLGLWTWRRLRPGQLGALAT